MPAGSRRVERGARICEPLLLVTQWQCVSGSADRHTLLNSPDLQLPRPILLKGHQSIVMLKTSLMAYGNLALMHVVATTLTKIQCGMIGEIMLYRAHIPRDFLQNPHDSMTETMMNDNVDSGEIAQTTVPGDDFHQVFIRNVYGTSTPNPKHRNHADTNGSTQKVSPWHHRIPRNLPIVMD